MTFSIGDLIYNTRDGIIFVIISKNKSNYTLEAIYDIRKDFVRTRFEMSRKSLVYNFEEPEKSKWLIHYKVKK